MKKKNIVIAAIAAFIMMLFAAIPANAAVINCVPSGAPSTARLSTSTWNSSYYNGNLLVVRYTHHLDVNSGGYFAKESIVVRGVTYSPDDTYIYDGYSSITVTGYWKETVLPGTENQYRRLRSCTVISR